MLHGVRRSGLINGRSSLTRHLFPKTPLSRCHPLAPNLKSWLPRVQIRQLPLPIPQPCGRRPAAGRDTLGAASIADACTRADAASRQGFLAGAPTDPDVPIRASGSSACGFASVAQHLPLHHAPLRRAPRLRRAPGRAAASSSVRRPASNAQDGVTDSAEEPSPGEPEESPLPES
jgi:hypothetical protein